MDYFDEEVQTPGAVDCRFVTGPAGTGKTYQFKQRIEADESEGILCATTGVAAVNLGTTTINSVLGYFDLESLADASATGQITRRLIHLRKREGYKSLMLDEASMLEAYALDILTEDAKKANQRLEKDGLQISLELTGDFAQLPPVKGEWGFKAVNWPLYAANLTKLDKIYRQTDLEFLRALSLARQGDGKEASEALRPLAKWSSALDLDFDGTTIVDKNSKVDDINKLRYLKLKGAERSFFSHRWGKQRGEWKQIPAELKLREGASVMILANVYSDPLLGRREIIYANGDSGIVVGFTGGGAWVRLRRTNEVIQLSPIERTFESKDEPDKSAHPNSYYDEKRKRWVWGAVSYLPARLDYAVTVHKSQGLTLDKVQLDPRGAFFGSPNMAYVALSRVRTPQGLKIVGTAEMFARRINRDKEVGEWI